MSSLMEKLLARSGSTLDDVAKTSKVGRALAERGVQQTPEWRRIVSLARRVLDLPAVPDLTPVFRHRERCSYAERCPYCRKGPAALRPIQSASLLDGEAVGGLFAPITVGEGKTLTMLLLPEAIPCKTAVLLVRPNLRDQLILKDMPDAERHFRLPTAKIHVVSYSTLQVAKTADVLDRIRPDLIVADEMHNLRRRDSARTKRFLRYMRENPACAFAGLSGSITKKNLRDFAHLLELALRKSSPLPLAYRELAAWDDVVGVDGDGRTRAGALLELCGKELRDEELASIEGELAVAEVLDEGRAARLERDAARRIFRRRFVETVGVVSSGGAELGCSLTVSRRVPIVPGSIDAALRRLRNSWAVAGEEIEDAMAFARFARQIACGFYYRWVWPNDQPDHEWLEARAAWHKEVRGFLQHSSRKGLDSPLLLANAAKRHLGTLKSGGPTWDSSTWAEWERVSPRWRPHPPVETVWLDSFLVDDAIAWARKREGEEGGGLVWYEHDAFGRAVAEKGGFPLFAGGDDRALITTTPARSPICVVSIKAHGEGKNLQAWRRSYLPTPWQNGVEAEQVIGRTHREGQDADEVDFDVCLHTEELEAGIAKAYRDALYIQDTTGQRQKLAYAERIGW